MRNNGWLLRAFQLLGATLLLAFGYCFICFMTGGSVMIELLNAGTEKHVSLVLGILIALGCFAFLAFNHKLRDLIRDTGVDK